MLKTSQRNHREMVPRGHEIPSVNLPPRLLSWFRYPNQKPLLCLAIGKMDQGRSSVLRQIGESGFRDGPVLPGYDPGDSLALFICHSFDRLCFARECVLHRTSDSALLAERKLHIERWRRAGCLAILRESKHAQG